jgi:beta-aspartyl-dipeptidase (metallo-type)
MILIKNIELYAPQYLGKKDVLIGKENILSIEKEIDLSKIKGIEPEVIDAKGKFLVPGLVDAHIHISGAGGEGGPKSRTPEVQLSHLLQAGITTAVGCLGTDGYTRKPAEVLMKAKALKEEGISVWMYTGSYQIPPPSVTGSIAHDITFIEEVIGVGEIALSDIRSSHPSKNRLVQLAQEAKVAGMLAGKAGILNIHMGDAKNPFKPLTDAVENTELSLKQFFPTHCNRNHYIFEDAKTYGKLAYVDLTTSSYPYFSDLEVKPAKAIKELLNAGVPEAHISMTSDAIGSLPGFDENGKLERLDIGQADTLFKEFRDAVLEEKLPVETALKTVSLNPANTLKLYNKGRIATGLPADLLLLNKDFTIHSLYAKGRCMIKNNHLTSKGIYE